MTLRAKQSEQRVRARIRQSFKKLNQGAKSGTIERVEGQVVALIKEYCSAPKEKREAIYSRGEKRILESARTRRA